MSLKYHFIGIKGSGMSALAQILYDKGVQVTGSDIEDYVFTEEPLLNRGIKILPFSEENVQCKKTIYVIGNAFNISNNEEVRFVLDNDLNNTTYSDLLSTLVARSVNSIGVSGIHGKTTVTNILSHILKSQHNTEYLIGDGRGCGLSDSDFFIFESCEYKDVFLNYFPKNAIITNLGFDHPDFFKDEEQVIKSFSNYIENVSDNVIIYGDDEKFKGIKDQEKLSTFGLKNYNDFIAKNINYTKNGINFDFYRKDTKLGSFFFPGFGQHNLLNILGVLSLLDKLGLDVNLYKSTISNVPTAKRRFNVEKHNDNWLVNDYAHHPTEIKSVYDAIKHKFPDKKYVLIFQPHTYSRTLKFINEYKSSFSNFDELYLCDIFSSKRESRGNINSSDIINYLGYGSLIKSDNVDLLSKYEDTIISFLGAGDIERIINSYKKIH